jgi:hypothetical protein
MHASPVTTTGLSTIGTAITLPTKATESRPPVAFMGRFGFEALGGCGSVFLAA